MIRAANAYIDRQAPWALRKTDPARMAAVLRVLADALRVIATVLQPFMPGSMGRDARPARRSRRGARRSPRWRTAARRHRRCRRRRACSRASSRTRRKPLMLIDSHCHLDYFTPAELPGVLARAAAAGVGEMVTIGTRLAQAAEVLGAGRGASRRLVHGRHASAPCRRGAGARRRRRSPRWPSTPRSSASASPGSTISTTGRRATCSRRLSAPISGPPGWPACRSCIHARDADDDIAAILREERDAGRRLRLPAALLQLRPGLAEAGVAMGGYVSFSGILTFPKSDELREIARDLPADRLLVETDAPYLAPVPFRGKRNEPA